MANMTSSYAFFVANAGYSYDPITETPMQGRRRCARTLAQAETRAKDAGCSFEWGIDDARGSLDWTDKKPEWASWYCKAYDGEGKQFASLCGIDFGPDREPWGNPYRRVVEAELACELEPK